MSMLLYYLIIFPLSILPYSILYLISDGLFLIIYYLVGYRKKVVVRNISNSFPSKTDAEHRQIAKNFYRHFCDLIVETIKTFSIKPKRAFKRMKVLNPELTDQFMDAGQDIIITGGHYANWEAFTYTAKQHKHELVALFTPLSNKFFNKKMKSSREKCGMQLVSTKQYKKLFTEDHQKPRAYIFSIDQAPRKGSGYRMEFLNQDSMVLFGTERTSKKYDLPVIFGAIRKVKRGYFEIEYELIIDKPQLCEEGEITEKITRRLEKLIYEEPEYWLWTHKRWKHKPENIKKNV